MVDGEPIGLLLALTFSSQAPVVVTPPAAIPSGGGSLWKKKKPPLQFSYLDQMNLWRDEILEERDKLAKKKKKKREEEARRKALEELADSLAGLEAKLPETDARTAWAEDIARGLDAAERTLTLANLQFQIKLVEEIYRELEDEDVILLLTVH